MDVDDQQFGDASSRWQDDLMTCAEWNGRVSDRAANTDEAAMVEKWCLLDETRRNVNPSFFLEVAELVWVRRHLSASNQLEEGVLSL